MMMKKKMIRIIITNKYLKLFHSRKYLIKINSNYNNKIKFHFNYSNPKLPNQY